MAKYTIKANPWAYAHASEWDLPLLIMHGDADAIAYVSGSEEFTSQIAQDCTLKIWPGLWHETHNEPEKEQVLAYALGWLDGQVKLSIRLSVLSWTKHGSHGTIRAYLT